jgi:DNA-binding MarR family transcriptional regulator
MAGRPSPEPETAEDAVMGLMMALGRRLRQHQPGDLIEYSSFPILKLLCHQGPSRLSALAQVLGLDASTVSRHVKQLEDRGLLARTDDPDDRRASRVDISARGRSILDDAFAARRGLITDALDDWSDEEREMLRSLLHRLVGTLASHADQTAATDAGTPST